MFFSVWPKKYDKCLENIRKTGAANYGVLGYLVKPIKQTHPSINMSQQVCEPCRQQKQMEIVSASVHIAAVHMYTWSQPKVWLKSKAQKMSTEKKNRCFPQNHELFPKKSRVFPKKSPAVSQRNAPCFFPKKSLALGVPNIISLAHWNFHGDLPPVLWVSPLRWPLQLGHLRAVPRVAWNWWRSPSGNQQVGVL